MFNSHAIRCARSFAVLAGLCLCVFVRPASAGSVTLTLNPGSLTVAEGNTLTVTFTVTNGTSGPITSLDGPGVESFISGDTSEFPGITFVAGGCAGSGGVFGVTVAAGDSCTYSLKFITENPAGETDADFGTSSFTPSFDFCFGASLANCPTFGSVPQVTGSQFIITVTDPGFTGGTTPEPPSLLLLGTGLLGLGFFARRRLGHRTSHSH